MADLLPLRPYQRDAIDAVRKALPVANRQAVVMPTGTGKTVVFTHMIKGLPIRSRSLVLVHREELALQAQRAIHNAAPHLRTGIVKAERDDVDADTVIASVPTLSRDNRLERYLHHGAPALVCVDEAHHSAADSWRKVLEGIGSFDGVPTVGFSATLSRADDKQLSDIWDGVAYRADILDMIRAGWLCDVSAIQVAIPDLDLSKVRSSGGDYSASQLGVTLRDAGVAEIVTAAYRQHADGRRAIAFTPDVATAQAVTDTLQASGVPSETITADTTREERAAIYERFRTGTTLIMVSVMVLTEGFDAPWAEVAIIARPTRSSELYVQMVGRVLRPWKDKHSALVLDVVGATSAHALATLADLSPKLVKPPAEGETLLDAADRAVARATDGATGDLVSRDIDLFAASHSAWLQTAGGTWFVPTVSELFFLWPGTEAGLWNAGRRPVRGRGGEWIVQDVGMEAAMAWAEQAMTEAEGVADFSVGSRAAAWRKGRSKATDKQKNMALSLKISFPEGVSKAQLSDLISIKMAERVFDR